MSYGNQTSAGASLAAPRQPRLVELAERFERSLSEFQNLNVMARGIAERALGTIPETVSKEAQGPGPATVGKLEAYQAALDGMLSALRGTLDRLDAL